MQDLKSKQMLGKEVKEILERARMCYLYSQSPNFCFDFIARKEELIMLIKLLFNIDSITPSMAFDMKNIAGSLSGCPLIIGKKTRAGEMEDDVVYVRYGINSITPSTLENFLIHNIMPCIISARGGYYLSINGEKLREIRLRKAFSIGMLAERAGISRRMVLKYERNEANPTIEIAEKLFKILDRDFSKEIDVFSQHFAYADDEFDIIEDFLTNYKKKIIEKLSEFNLKVKAVKRAPFDAIALTLEDEKFTTRAEEKPRLSQEEARFFREVIETTLINGFFVFKERKGEELEGIPIIGEREINKMHSHKELVELIEKRKAYSSKT